MARKRSSQASVLMVYVSTMLICLMIFGSAALFLLNKFVIEPRETAKNPTNDTTQSAVDYSYANETILFIGAEGTQINGCVILRVLPTEGKIFVVPISNNTLSLVGTTTGMLTELYKIGGTDYLIKGIEYSYGISFDKYIKMNNFGFDEIVEYFGGAANYEFPKPLIYEDKATGEMTAFASGVSPYPLNGYDIRKVVTYPLYLSGEEQLNALGGVTVSLLNTAFSSNSDSITKNMQDIIITLLNNSETNVTQVTFKEVKKAYEYMLKTFDSPASYIIPTGQWEGDIFNISQESVAEIKEFLGI